MKDMNRVLSPANRYEQVTGSIDFICEHAKVPSPFNTMTWPMALEYAAFHAIQCNIVSGYNFKVLQRAIRDHLNYSNPTEFTPIYTHEELYED